MADHTRCARLLARVTVPLRVPRKPEHGKSGQQGKRGQQPGLGRHAHPADHLIGLGRKYLQCPELQQAGMLFQCDVAQGLVDARQQLLILPADQQAHVGGESHLERLHLQRAGEVLPDHRLQCGFHSDRNIGHAGLHGGQGGMAIRQVQQRDPRVMGGQPFGIRPAVDHRQCAAVQLRDVVWQSVIRAPGQQGPAAAEGGRGRQVVAGRPRMPGRPDHQHEVGVATAYGVQ
ncbi:hypothetical protein [Stenotrophomonas maltophilia]|uniref:hypothetical protein n=1 Tax=Stenotrophomonas maltophilia TaxID=40324 RepID=UPI003CCDB1A3